MLRLQYNTSHHGRRGAQRPRHTKPYPLPFPFLQRLSPLVSSTGRRRAPRLRGRPGVTHQPGSPRKGPSLGPPHGFRSFAATTSLLHYLHSIKRGSVSCCPQRSRDARPEPLARHSPRRGSSALSGPATVCPLPAACSAAADSPRQIRRSVPCTPRAVPRGAPPPSRLPSAAGQAPEKGEEPSRVANLQPQALLPGSLAAGSSLPATTATVRAGEPGVVPRGVFGGAGGDRNPLPAEVARACSHPARLPPRLGPDSSRRRLGLELAQVGTAGGSLIRSDGRHGQSQGAYRLRGRGGWLKGPIPCKEGAGHVRGVGSPPHGALGADTGCGGSWTLPRGGGRARQRDPPPWRSVPAEEGTCSI